MAPRQTAYYDRLAQNYPTIIRQLVPRYDELVATIVGLVAGGAPAFCLDVGAGDGSLAERLLEACRGASLIALEPNAAMAAAARSRLVRFEDRALVLPAAVEQYEPPRSFGAVTSNLVLHNLPMDVKQEVLARVRRWLAPGGVFVWGDLIRYDDPAIQQYCVDHRIRFAREAGCPEALIAVNFAKEGSEDFPLTVLETLHAASEAGFDAVEVVWVAGTFAVFHSR